MRVLIIGSGGREHALAWKAAQSPTVDQVYVAPGNAGTDHEAGVENIDICADDIDALLIFARQNRIDLTIVGPEAPLVAGITDRFNKAGLRCFGPLKNAAQLEGSKTFAKDFLARHNIPTAAYDTFVNIELAQEYIKHIGMPVVIKADGLAAGKGVVIANTPKQAQEAIHSMLADNRFGEAGQRVVIEEFLKGEEVSYICIVDGEDLLPMVSSQDHKARDDGDKGPNTGGMGAYSPAAVMDEYLNRRILDEIMLPTIKGLKSDGIDYTGFLYAGLMVDSDGNPKVLEFNCRLGDPETQPIMMRLNSDLVELCLAAVNGNLKGKSIVWEDQKALGVVMAAAGYPEHYEKGHIIKGLDKISGKDVKVFHASTTKKNGEVVTNGGRVLCVTALGDNVTQAQHKAYQAINNISWKGACYRCDIGYRAVEREVKR